MSGECGDQRLGGDKEGEISIGRQNKQTNCKTMVLKTMFSDYELFHLLCKSSTSDLGTGYSNEYSKVTG